jgi:hypothetical protein
VHDAVPVKWEWRRQYGPGSTLARPTEHENYEAHPIADEVAKALLGSSPITLFHHDGAGHLTERAGRRP